MTLLTIVQDASAELSIPSPSAVVASTDLQVQLLLRLANKEGKELARRAEWTQLTIVGLFAATDVDYQQALLSQVAPDFGHLINESMWNRTTNWPVQGPLSPVEWEARLASGTQTGTGNWFRIYNNKIYFYPIPTDGDQIAFEYISNEWCQSVADVGQSRWAADSDTALLDEELMTMGVIWRFLKAKGLDYSEEFATYERAFETILGYDGAKKVIDFTGATQNYLPLPTIPDGNWETS